VRSTTDRPLETSIASIDEEVEAEPKRSSIDRDAVRTKKDELVDFAAGLSGELRKRTGPKTWVEDPSLKGELKIHIAVVEHGFTRVEGTIALHNKAVSRQARFSAETRDLTTTVHDVLNRIRGRMDKRLGTSKLARSIKDECAVGGFLNPDAPVDIFDRAVLVLDVLKDEKNAALFLAKRIDPGVFIVELAPDLAKLKDELAKGPGTVKKGEGTDDINAALRFLEIAFERLIGFLEDHGCGKQATILGERIPRRFTRRAADAAEKAAAERAAAEKAAAEKAAAEKAAAEKAAAEKAAAEKAAAETGTATPK
jgi:hypothetical protein